MWKWLLVLPIVIGSVVAEEVREPSEFRLFSDKDEKKIEARILSIAEDSQTIELEKTDGGRYEIAVTILSLDDQQFVREWLKPAAKLPGRLQVFGVLPKEKVIDVSAAAGESSFESIHAAKFGWMAVLPDGRVLDSAGRYTDLTPISSVASNTVWVAMTGLDGSFVNGAGNVIHPEINSATRCVAGNGHSAALLKDGTVKVFGRRYGIEESMDAPGELPPIVSLASTQSSIAAIDEEGAVHCWMSGEDPQPVSFMPGEGAVEVQGTIFGFIALTRDGKVYQWRDASVESVRTPTALEEGETYIKVRSNGSTWAAQRKDKTWIAWGMNGAGIVDHINNLGPIEDIAFFTEPGKEEHGFVVWIETE